MKIEVVIRKEDGTVVEEQYYHALTEIQWRKQWYKPKRFASPIYLDWWISSSRMKGAAFYDFRDVQPMGKREVEKIRRTEAEKRYEKRQEKKWYKDRPYWDDAHTAWQWLSKYGRIPAPGKKAFPEFYENDEWIDEFGDRHNAYSHTWYYYQGEDTIACPLELKEKLKTMYIEKFGGWEKIDLNSTTYDGHIWWTDDDLKGFKLPKVEIKKWPKYKPKKKRRKPKEPAK